MKYKQLGLGSIILCYYGAKKNNVIYMSNRLYDKKYMIYAAAMKPITDTRMTCFGITLE